MEIRQQLHIANFIVKSSEQPSRKPCNYHHRVVQLARSDRRHLIFSSYFSRVDKTVSNCLQ